MKKFLKIALLSAATAAAGVLSAAGLWGRSSAPAPQPAAPRIEVRAKPAPAPAQRAPVGAAAATAISREGVYFDKDNICRYIVAYGSLPSNFITKNEARRLGWTGGPLERFAPGKAIGGDRYGNYERALPNGRYRECDVDTFRRPRGAKRIVFSDDRRVYYSDDHYRTFKRLH